MLMSKLEIPSGMEIAPRYILLYTVYTICTVQTALHCLNNSMYANISCWGRLERYWNGLMASEQNVGWVSKLDTP